MAFEGYVDRADSKIIEGWAWDSDDPDKSVSVNIRINGRIVGSAQAFLYRNDLKVGGYGSGKYGFQFCPILFVGQGETEYSVEFSETSALLKRGSGVIQPNQNIYNVIEGKEKYLFLHRVDDRSLLDQITGRERLSAQQSAMYETVFRVRQALAGYIGADYAMAVVPDKMACCPSLLPGGITPSADRIAFQVLHIYRKVVGEEGFYMDPPISEDLERAWTLTTDSHLSPEGYLQYFTKLMKHLARRPSVVGTLKGVLTKGKNKMKGTDRKVRENLPKALRLPDEWIEVGGFAGDLAGRSPKPVNLEVKREFAYSVPKAKVVNMGGINEGRFVESSCSDGAPLRVLLVGSSSAEHMLPLFQENFGYVYYKHAHVLDYELLFRVKPDLILHVVTERTLHTLPSDILMKR